MVLPQSRNASVRDVPAEGPGGRCRKCPTATHRVDGVASRTSLRRFPIPPHLLLRLRGRSDAAAVDAAVGVGHAQPRGSSAEILQDAIDGLPEELRQLRWLLKERAEVLERAEHEAARIIDVARVRFERVWWSAPKCPRRPPRSAEDTIDQGRPPRRADAPRGRGLRRPQALASFEVVLDRTMQQVAKGRERLQVDAPAHEDLLGPDADVGQQAFFDQERPA